MTKERVPGRTIDGHSHIGAMDAWKFYDLKEPVKPTVYDFATARDVPAPYGVGIERALVLPNYGIPVQAQPFSLNPLVLDTVRVERPHPGRAVGVVPPAEPGHDDGGPAERGRGRDRRAQDHVPAGRQS